MHIFDVLVVVFKSDFKKFQLLLQRKRHKRHFSSQIFLYMAG